MKVPALFIGTILLALSCSSGGDGASRPVISVSIIPQQYFIEQLAGDLVDINVMVPPGASPATYGPTVSQLGKLDRSVVYMRMGYIGFEQSWMDKIASVNQEMKIVDLSEGIDVLMEEDGEDEVPRGHAHNGPDPHIWMSVINARIITRNILNELLLLLPGKREYLFDRYDQFSAKLDSLDQAITEDLQTLENRKFLIYHPALTYYARDYGLEQFSLEIEGKTPSPAHLKQMTDLANNDHITKILIQNQFDRKNAEVLAKETGAEIVQFDPLDLHWSEQMSYIAKQLNPPIR
jgi:zinc transport system substrate-binding protein